MIRTVTFENYRSVRSAVLRLSPLTVLVGPNGAGKTNVLRGLAGDRGGQVAWRGEPHFRVLGAEKAQGAPIYRMEPHHLRLPNGIGHAPRLSESGQNLVQVIDSLGRKRQAEYAQALCRLVPMFSDVEVLPRGGNHRLVFKDRWKEDLEIETDAVSDGTLYVAAYLALARQLDRPALVCIEEPERGLHPWLLEEVVKVLRSIATDAARPMQVVLATQSPALLNHCAPDEVRFVDRDPTDGSTRITEAPTDREAWNDAFAAHKNRMGAMWLTGALGGVPKP